MSRKLIAWAGTFVAVLTLTLASGDAEARQCRNRCRNRCCRQTTNCGYEQANNCGYGNRCGQTHNYGSAIGCGSRCGGGCGQQTGRYTSTDCCTSQSSFGNVTPVSGTMQPTYDTSTSAGSMPPTPIATPPAPAPGA